MGTTAAATFCATLTDEWVRAGVTDAVVAPGSRSSPLALALAADGRLRLHVHHDERSAAFLALGLGLAAGRPAVLLATSGTAAVELHPAVVEAGQAGVPMLVCTADRPPELHGVGAPQTVDQTHLFGRAVRWFAEPGVPDAAAAVSWRSLAARAAAEACGPPAGPVHLNLAFRDPLVGQAGQRPGGRPGGRPWHERLVARAADEALLDAVAAALDGARGVIVAGGGAGDPSAIHGLAEAAGWPVLADPRSGCRVPAPTTVAAFDALLRHGPFADDHRPDVVVRLGAPPASKVLAQWLGASGARQVAIAADGRWWDPERSAELVVRADPGAVCRALVGRVEGARGTPWLARWSRAERLAQGAFDAALQRHAEATEPGSARAVVGALPDGASLVVSSSMPVRDVEWYARPRAGLRVLANRGANGIDGVTSTAVGVALAGPAPTTALLGDIAFLHDANGLLGAASRGIDLTVVVIDNGGGGIFAFLPQASSVPPDRFEQLFGTPHGVDPCLVAAAHGVASATVDRAVDVGPAVAEAVGSGGVRLVRVRTDRSANVAVHDELHTAVAGALGGR